MLSRFIVAACVAVLATATGGVSAGTCAGKPVALARSPFSDTATFRLCYSYTSTQLYVELSTFAITTGGWVGFGFSPNVAMGGSSVIVGAPSIAPNNYNLGNRTGTGPANQTTLAITGGSISVANDEDGMAVTTLAFSLPLVNGAYVVPQGASRAGTTLLESNGDTNIIFARGPVEDGAVRQHNTKGSTYAYTFLRDADPAGPTSICDRAASARNAYTAVGEYDLVQSIVTRAINGYTPSNPSTRAVDGLVVNAYTKGFFNGTIGKDSNGSPLPDYTTNLAKTTALVNSLTRFFGAILECSAGDFKTHHAYNGSTDMTAVHKNMPITQEIFNAFTTQITDSVASYGIPLADVDTISGLLLSYQRASSGATTSICNQAPSCTCAIALGYSGPSCTKSAAASIQLSIFSVILTAFAAIFTMRQ